MTKQEQITAKLSKPFEVGDIVNLVYPYVVTETTVKGKGKNKETVQITKNKTFSSIGKILAIVGDKITITNNNSSSLPYNDNNIVKSYGDNNAITADKKFFEQNIDKCGSNPFSPEKNNINFYNQDISTLLFKAGFGRKAETLQDEDYNKINFNPHILDKDGSIIYYQRDLVWSLSEKQLLIDSIYSNIEIGKFLMRYNSWERMKVHEAEHGVMFGLDCIDGKQRYNTIIEFVLGKFQDSHGNFWGDLSSEAHSRFLNYRNLSYGEMGEMVSDTEVIENFLTLNFTGVPMSKDHIDFVKNIKLK